MAEIMSKYRMWLIGIVVSILLSFSAIVNVWALRIVTAYDENNRQLEYQINQKASKQEVEELSCKILDKIDARFDKFELYFQTKYKIVPK